MTRFLRQDMCVFDPQPASCTRGYIAQIVQKLKHSLVSFLSRFSYCASVDCVDPLT